MRKIFNFIVKNKTFSFFLFLLLVVISVAIFADYIAPYSPYDGELKNAFLEPSIEHLFGTDKLGRDIFSRVLFGTRISLGVSVVLVVVIAATGTVLGLVSGYTKGILDKVIMRIADILMSCPSMVLAIALAGILGASLKNAMIAIFVVTISKYIRLVRSLVVKTMHEDYIKAAKMSGTSSFNILFKHILPNIFGTILVTASTDIGAIILELSALSFLGFGVSAPTPELGLMISEGRDFMLSSPWQIIFPGIAIYIIVSIFNTLSDKLQDILAQ